MSVSVSGYRALLAQRLRSMIVCSPRCTWLLTRRVGSFSQSERGLARRLTSESREVKQKVVFLGRGEAFGLKLPREGHHCFSFITANVAFG
jgi:hypothetical protein